MQASCRYLTASQTSIWLAALVWYLPKLRFARLLPTRRLPPFCSEALAPACRVHASPQRADRSEEQQTLQPGGIAMISASSELFLLVAGVTLTIVGVLLLLAAVI
jgi:hypothetical protein